MGKTSGDLKKFTMARKTPLMFAPMLFVFGLAGFVAWQFTQYCVTMIRGGGDSFGGPVTGWLFLLGFYVIFGVWLTSYLRCVFHDVGTVPRTAVWRIPEARADGGESGDVRPGPPPTPTGEPRRACNRCQVYKCDRSHHCSMCDACILRYDHHCPWVCNCVGFGNYKFFCLFLLWTSLLGVYTMACIGAKVAHFDFDQQSDITLMVAGLIAAVFGLGLSCFFGTHAHFSMQNQTTVESMGYNRINIFDLASKRENFVQVFGTNPWLWFLPVANSLGDGVFFPVNPALVQQAVRSRQRPILPPLTDDLTDSVDVPASARATDQTASASSSPGYSSSSSSATEPLLRKNS